MANRSKLLTALGGDKAEQSEFETVLLGYFGRAAHLSNREILYSNREGGAALSLVYNANGLLKSAEGGPNLKDEDVKNIRTQVDQELLTPGPARVRRRILFCGVPTKGWFRYGDVFQIVPLPDEAPRPNYMLGDHPLVLEFKYPSSSHSSVSLDRQQRIGRELELICSALLAWRLWSIGPQSQHHWTVELTGNAAQITSKFLQEAYMWPGMVVEAETFSPTGTLTPLTTVDPQMYYSYTHGAVGPGLALDIPGDLTRLLDAVWNLTRQDRDRFLRAGYWFQHAHNVRTLSLSAAFVSLVSAIEALSSGPRSDKRCDECGQLVGPGPTKLFADFVEAHLPGTSIPEPERKRFYRLRSGLSHGGKLLLSDHSLWDFSPSTLDEDHAGRVLWQIAQTVLRNWLIMRP